MTARFDSGRLMALTCLTVTATLASGCGGRTAGAQGTFDPTVDSPVASDSKEFAGARIGGRLIDYAVGPADQEDGGPTFYSGRRASLGYDGDCSWETCYNNPALTISSIYFVCGRSTGNTSIDGVSCNTDPSPANMRGWEMLCRLHDFSRFDHPEDGRGLTYLRKNAVVYAKFPQGAPAVVQSLSIVGPQIKKHILEAHKPCPEVDRLRAEARSKGFESLGDMILNKEDQTATQGL